MPKASILTDQKQQKPESDHVHVTSEGRLEVDPMSIIKSDSVMKHLELIKGVAGTLIKKPATP